MSLKFNRSLSTILPPVLTGIGLDKFSKDDREMIYQILHFFQGEEVGHGAVLPNVVSFTHFCVALEPEIRSIELIDALKL